MEQRFETEQLNELFTALAKAQGTMKPAKKESENPYFKSSYADFNSVVEASRQALTTNGLAMIQRILPNGDGISYLATRLCHISGQWIESKMPIVPPKADIQSLGSYITYLKRYAYAAMVGVVTEDDDGEKAMENTRITQTQVQQMKLLYQNLPTSEKSSFLSALQVKEIEEITSDKFTGAYKFLKSKSEGAK